eukprot:4633891-Prymnesium_polylepis.2
MATPSMPIPSVQHPCPPPPRRKCNAHRVGFCLDDITLVLRRLCARIRLGRLVLRLRHFATQRLLLRRILPAVGKADGPPTIRASEGGNGGRSRGVGLGRPKSATSSCLASRATNKSLSASISLFLCESSCDHRAAPAQCAPALANAHTCTAVCIVLGEQQQQPGRFNARRTPSPLTPRLLTPQLTLSAPAAWRGAAAWSSSTHRPISRTYPSTPPAAAGGPASARAPP